MIYAIATWNLPDDVIIVMEGNGSDKPALFDTEKDAEDWANENIAFNYRVIDLN